MELMCVDHLVPQDHLLRLIDEYVDFSFILEKVRPCYSEIGRPSIDPVRLFKMMLIGYLYGIRSERQLEKEIIPNAAYRWFLGMSFADKVPDHSTISRNRTHRFRGSNLFQEIFDEVVRLAIGHNMVAGRVLITDSSHIRANANNNRYTMQVIEETPHEFLAELDKAIDEDRKTHEKKSLPPRKETTETKTKKVSLTDPESGFMKRDGKPEGFYYLDHRTVDHKFNIITDVFVTPGHVNDAAVYIDRLQRQINTFKFPYKLEAVALDSGYMTPYICKKTLGLDLFPVIAERTAPSAPGIIPKSKFVYDREQDLYTCPAGQSLTYVTTNRAGYREYCAERAICAKCPVLQQCTTAASGQRKIQRHVWEDSKEQVIQNRKSEQGETTYKLRAQTIERSFADAKELHGYRRCKFRGKVQTQEQVCMTATAQNIKKIVRHLDKLARKGQDVGQRTALFSNTWAYLVATSLNYAA